MVQEEGNTDMLIMHDQNHSCWQGWGEYQIYKYEYKCL